MYDEILPFALGAVSTLAENAGRVGNRYVVDSVEYKLLKDKIKVYS